MFLLRLYAECQQQFFQCNLHSNMFLLRLQSLSISKEYVREFTFQYVSIKTGVNIRKTDEELNLHSNMFLLRLSASVSTSPAVSNLHSNMFLLRPYVLLI